MDHVPGRGPLNLAEPTLEALLAPALAPLFARPSRIGVDSAWYGHVPFARWIVHATRPRTIVELGTQGGVSYSAFCDAVLAEGLDARCYAVDTWTGDEHAGFYDAQVLEAWRAFHDARYGAFSRLIRATFDAALTHVPDGSVDLLHIDGRHRAEDVTHDFDSWRRKLSHRAVVLFHDTNVRDGDFGVWGFWADLAVRYPSFEFLHAHGLGVAAVGPDAPAGVLALCGLDTADTASARERFALLGERWALTQETTALRQATAPAPAPASGIDGGEERRALAFQIATLRNQAAMAAEAERKRRAAHEAALSRADQAEAAAREAAARETAALTRLAGAQRELDRARHQLDVALRQADAAVWQFESLRHRLDGLPRLPRRIHGALARVRLLTPLPLGEAEPVAPPPRLAPPPPAEPVAGSPAEPPAEAAPHPAPPTADARPRILFISGEPETPGHYYRVVHGMQLAEAAGWRADWSEVAPVGPHTLAGASIVVLWRVPWSPHVQGIIDASGEIGAHVLFDVDDLVFKPELARIEVIDGIRTTETTESAIGSFFAMVNRALDKCALSLVTTEELAEHVRSIGRVAVVLPNGFDEATRRRARLAMRRRHAGGSDGLVRLGYATGSRTHQRDFATIAGALAAVLRARPETRLVLFRDPRGGEGVVLLHEFPELAGLEAQVEWRDMVPWPDLPDEMARFDVNLAPLETGNVFCEAKSELKYFEAALAGVTTVSSPAGPLARAIRHGETGFLATSPADWEGTLCALVDDPALRARVAQHAYHDILWRFGERRREEMLLGLLRELRGGADGARAFELKLRRADHLAPGLPHIPASAVRFESDALGDAAVTVMVPVYNYAGYVLEALESVATQTLDPLDLVVIDDASTDESLDLVLEWARHHAGRFNRLIVRRHAANAGLGFARNSGFAAAETPFVLPLDADNRLHADCAETLLARLRASRAAFAYPAQRQFGDKGAVFGDAPYWPSALVTGNYIDALALVAKWAWAAAGGYDHVRHGWEDYDFWCRLAEMGLDGEHVPAVLADYRVHKASMLARSTDVRANKQALIGDLRRRHPWLRIPRPS